MEVSLSGTLLVALIVCFVAHAQAGAQPGAQFNPYAPYRPTCNNRVDIPLLPDVPVSTYSVLSQLCLESSNYPNIHCWCYPPPDPEGASSSTDAGRDWTLFQCHAEADIERSLMAHTLMAQTLPEFCAEHCYCVPPKPPPKESDKKDRTFLSSLRKGWKDMMKGEVRYVLAPGEHPLFPGGTRLTKEQYQDLCLAKPKQRMDRDRYINLDPTELGVRRGLMPQLGGCTANDECVSSSGGLKCICEARQISQRVYDDNINKYLGVCVSRHLA